MPNWMGLRAYGRHRGDTHAAVQKAIKSGRLHGAAINRDASSGRILAIDQELADAQWAENTDLIEAAKNGKVLTPPASDTSTPASANSGAPHADPARQEQGIAAPSDPSASGPGAGSDSGELPLEGSPGGEPRDPAKPSKDDPHGFYESRARKMQWDEKQAELDFLKAVGLVVSREDLAKVNARRYRAMRDKLQGIPDRRCDELSVETDPTKIHAILLQEINQVLNELADDASAQDQPGAAAAPAECVAA